MTPDAPEIPMISRLVGREGSVILTILADLCTARRGARFGVTRRIRGVKILTVRNQLGGRL